MRRMSVGEDYTERVSQIEVSPGGVGFIRTPAVSVPGVPETAKRQTWVVDGTAAAKSGARGDATVTRGIRGVRFRKTR